MNFFTGLRRLFGGGSSASSIFAGWSFPTRSAVSVSAKTALQASAVLCAARVIAEGVAQCPLKLYEETNDPGGTIRQPARDHQLYDLLAYQPCHLTSFEFREMLTFHAVVEGNGYAVKNRGGDPGGDVVELIPVMPHEIEPLWNEYDEPVYRLTKLGKVLPKSEVLHLRGPSWDGLLGMKVRELACEAIGLSRAMEQSHADLYSKGGRPSGVLSTDVALAPEAIESLKSSWKAVYGPGGSGGISIMDNGMKFLPMEMNAVDAQYIETRKFLIEEVARSMRVFPQMLMHSDKTSTFASASEFFRAHVIHTLSPWVTRWEEVIKRDLIGFDEKSIWARFTLEALLRGDPEERAAFWEKMITLGVMSPNEVREKENLNPRPGGDEYLSPLNMRIGDDGADDDAKNSKQANLRAV